MHMKRFVRAGVALAPILACVTGAALAQDAAAGAPPDAPSLVCALPTNCVNSIGMGDLQALRFEGSAQAAMARLQATLAAFDGANVSRAEALHVEAIFTTPAGFKDRVDFVIDAQAGRIDFRSYSMFGLFDWGKNRSRMIDFSERFAQQGTR